MSDDPRLNIPITDARVDELNEFNKQAPKPSELDHPCKQTCSGWKQGFERGVAEEKLRSGKPSEMEGVREWIIDDSYDLVAGPHPGQERIVVVEKIAYDKLQAEHRADLKTAIEREYKLQQELADEQDQKDVWAKHSEKLAQELSSARREVEKWKEKYIGARQSGAIEGREEERVRSAELETQVAEYKKLVARDGYSAAEYEREKAKELLSALELAISELRPYSAGARDKSFNDWQRHWREVDIKHESDYSFYPNHVSKETMAELDLILKKHNSGKGG